LLEACQAQVAPAPVAPASVVACPLVVLVVLASVAGCPLVVLVVLASVAACLLVASVAACLLVDSVVLGELQEDNLSVRGLKVPPLSVHVVLISRSGSIH
jgi:hypothetical protein